MIVGIGIDLVELDRFKRVLEQPQFAAWIKKGAHPIEIKKAPPSQSARVLEYWASRFAVKEAFSKAIGVGLGKNFKPRKIGVRNKKSGKPEIIVEKKYSQLLKQKGFGNIHVSITHTKNCAQAIVIIEGCEANENSK